MKISDKALVLALVLAVTMWIADAGLDFLIFYEGTFLDLLILAVPPHELYISTSGTGLGLYISREILKSLSSTIELESVELSRGAAFKIIIPTTV